jgi:hypothetical protein
MAHSCLRRNATAGPQLAKAGTAFQAHPPVSKQRRLRHRKLGTVIPAREQVAIGIRRHLY